MSRFTPERLDQIKADDVVTLTIDGFGFRGEGFARLEDGWISVPNALPGEVVHVKILPFRPAARRIWGLIQEIESRSPDRMEPFCDQVKICRGCQLRHLSIPAELQFKSDTIRQVVEKYSSFQVDEIEPIGPYPFARPDSFRQRVSLSLLWEDEKIVCGINTPVADTLVPMGRCPAALESVQRLVRIVEAVLARQPAELLDEVERIRVASPSPGRGMIVMTGKRPSSEHRFALAAALEEKIADGISIFFEDDREIRHVRGPTYMDLDVAGMGLTVGPRTWFHATTSPAEALYDAIARWLQPSIDKGESLLDVGCGIGTIGLLYTDPQRGAANAAVKGLDHLQDAIEDARRNASRLKRDSLAFLCMGWERGLIKLRQQETRFQVATINPMREPLGPSTLRHLPGLGVKTVLYLGPSPKSAALDMQVLADLGYKLTRLGASNLHPATYHTMLVALLSAPQR